MKPAIVTVGSATFSAWIPVNEIQNNFQIGLNVGVTSGASLTCKVQHTFDEPGPEGLRDVKITRVTTTATVVDVDHRLSVGDNILVEQTGSSVLDGSYAVASVVSADSYTYTVANSGATADNGFAKLHRFRVSDHPTLTGLTARADGNYAFNIQACRLIATAWASGKADLTVLQGMGR